MQVTALTTDRNYHMLQLNDYRASKENLKWKVFEREIIVKAITVFVTQFEKEMCSVQDEKR